MTRIFLTRLASMNTPKLCRKALWVPAMACLCLPLAAQVDYATPYTFAFFAGSPGTAGTSDGTGTGAQFDQPNGLGIDSSGNIYVADKKNDTIRKITPAGVVTTLVGSPGVVGTTDATGSAASFNQPEGLAVGSGGDIYVADTSNDVIRKVTSAGVVTNLAGNFGTVGSTDGTGTAGLFNQPAGVAVDSSGNIYVADFGNDEIRKVTSGGAVTTIAGAAASPGSTDSATGTDARFNQPIAIAVDSSGNLYVADNGNNTIRKITSAGAVTTLAGNPGVEGSTDGSGSQALFKGPRGIAVDSSGNLYVTDGQNCTIRKVTPSGAVTTLAGSPGSFALSAGTGATAFFDVPVGIVVNSSGTLYVSNSLGYVISSGSVATNIAPLIVEQPTSQSIATGDTVVFQAQSYGLPAPTLQWYLNGVALVDGSGVSGSTTGTLVISGATLADAGTYYVVATNASGPVTSDSATLGVAATTNPGRLTNISCRALVGTGSNIMIAGFVVGGAGTSGSQSVLVRASGPALGLSFNIPGSLPDPMLTLSNVSDTPNQVVATDTGWNGSTTIATAAASLGAFPWSATSVDSAMLASLPGNNYTAEVAGASGDTGIGLVEVYDATPSGTYTLSTPRLTNLSARVQVGTGANTVYAGFVIGGSTAKTVLIRASGPALALSPFSLTGTLPDPQLTLTNVTTTNVVVASNTAWGGNAAIAAAASEAGAFPWGSTSLDSALLVTLPPGNYTAGVTGASGDTGTALIEIYEIP